MTQWPRMKLKYASRLGYGDALPRDKPLEGIYQVYGSNGPFSLFSLANTGSPAVIIGRKGSYGKVNWAADACFASDTTFFIDGSTTPHDLRWLYWLLQTLDLDQGSDETAVPGLNRDTIYSKEVVVPPHPQQRAIANYLDRETTRLDTLISTKRVALDLLTEKRLALITRVVTRGLDTTVPLRDSTIPWATELPAHWEIWKLGHIALIGNGSTPNRSNAAYWTDGTTPWLTSSIVNQHEATNASQFVTDLALRKCHLPLVKSGSVLVAITGQGKTRGRAVVLSFDATINQHLAYISADHSLLNPWFLRWILSSAYRYLRSISDAGGGTKGALTCESVANLHVPVPPIDEQHTIASYITKETSKLDRLRTAIQKTIVLLEERRASAIKSAISGQTNLENAICV